MSCACERHTEDIGLRRGQMSKNFVEECRIFVVPFGLNFVILRLMEVRNPHRLTYEHIVGQLVMPKMDAIQLTTG